MMLVKSSNFRLVPRVETPAGPPTYSLRAARTRLDFITRDQIGIRYPDMLKEARELLGREGIKDIVDLSEVECKQVLAHLLANTNRMKEKYPFWGK